MEARKAGGQMVKAPAGSEHQSVPPQIVQPVTWVPSTSIGKTRSGAHVELAPANGDRAQRWAARPSMNSVINVYKACSRSATE